MPAAERSVGGLGSARRRLVRHGVTWREPPWRPTVGRTPSRLTGQSDRYQPQLTSYSLTQRPKHTFCACSHEMVRRDLLGFCRERLNFGAQTVRLRQHRITFHVQASTVVGGCKSMYTGIVHTSRGRGHGSGSNFYTITGKMPKYLAFSDMTRLGSGKASGL